MIFIEEREKSERFYSVDYNKEKLKEILERLKDYSYVTIGHCQRAGDITRWPVTKNNIKKRVISSFNSKERGTI